MKHLELVHDEDRSLPIVHASATSLSGCADDPPGLEGVSRIAARLMRRTAGGASAEAVDERIDSMGASLSVDPGQGNISLAGSVLSRNLRGFLELLGEALVSPGLQEAELSRLRKESLDELIELRDDDEHLVYRWFTRTLFAGHPYGRSVIGNKESLAAIGVEDVRRCLRRRFCQGGIVWAFAGDFETADLRDSVERLELSLPSSSGPEAACIPPPPPVAGRHLVFVDKPQRSQTQILIGSLGVHPSDADYFDLLVANTAFGGTFTARLNQEVRAKRGWSYGAYSTLSFERERQSFSMWTFPSAEHAADCIVLQLQMLEALCDGGISESELSRAQAYLVRSRAFAADTTSKRVGQRLEEILYGLPERFYERYEEGVRSVSVESAASAVARRLSPRDLVVAVVGSYEEVGSAVREAVGETASARTVAYDED